MKKRREAVEGVERRDPPGRRGVDAGAQEDELAGHDRDEREGGEVMQAREEKIREH